MLYFQKIYHIFFIILIENYFLILFCVIIVIHFTNIHMTNKLESQKLKLKMFISSLLLKKYYKYLKFVIKSEY